MRRGEEDFEESVPTEQRLSRHTLEPWAHSRQHIRR
jgi:hypothetical protein